MATEKLANDAISTLNGAINNSVTSLILTSATLFPTSGQFRIRIDNEKLLVTNVVSNTLTVTRGIEGTIAASHTDGASVIQILTKGALNQIIADNNGYGTCATLPAVEKAGRIYTGSDFPIQYRDTGAAWQTFYQDRLLTLPITADYTWTNGGGTATNTDVTNGPTYLSVASTGSGDKISVFLKNIATPPYTVTTIFLSQFSPATFTYGGICLYDGTKLVIWGLLQDPSSSKWSLWYGKYNSLTSFNGDYTRAVHSLNINPLSLRIVDDNINRIVSFSNDGVNFVPVYSVGRTDFLTPTKIGMFVGTNAAATGNGVNISSALTWLSWADN